MNDIIKQFSKLGIIPVVKIDNAKDAAPLAKALCEGGLPVAEVTFRTDAAEEAIRIMSEQFPDMLVGAGTVLTTEQVDRAVNAGAKFIVSPGLNPKVVRYCQEKGVPITPGTSSPTDIEMALELGLDVVKFFPAEQSGGIAKIKAMAAPYTGVKFMPTGGVNAKNLKDYLDFPKIVACGGSWMVSGDLINAGNFDEIKRLTREAVNTMLGFEMKHVGINCENEAQALKTAEMFARFFGFEVKNGNSSVFASSSIELNKTPGPGKCGHIAIGTNYIERAIYHMQLQGFEFDMDSALYKNDKMVRIYMKDDFAGFAVHLVQK
ncbi:MAG: bifunctional 4-hydroxy-2-oxoglutarate aldolase/2-dehydro-3-deoxy-phosphogluconate aldolase [Lachnospiraceae bacterium]|nr:bifunctional 4-hydroxy-2-oxoglutarate aldolase/2-dehydro-3-deoxy-phosphogluconate aldolase [Lachnospiraceae bacterium]